MIHCLSCQINDSCLYNHVQMSPNQEHLILECLGPHTPIHYLIDVAGESLVEVLDNGDGLRRWLAKLAMPKIRHFSILTPANYYIRLQLIIPGHVNELDDAKYPLVLEANRLPGMQSVNYANKLDWNRYLTSRREYITARVDTRGSSHQGGHHLFAIYKRLGELEVEDMRTALTYIKQLSYVDTSKIAVWGQEYGGWLATALMASDESVACSATVSPITSWKNYCKLALALMIDLTVVLLSHSGLPLRTIHGLARGELPGLREE